MIPKQEGRLISCILPKGKGIKLLEALHKEKGVYRASFAFARGYDIHDPIGRKGVPGEVEKEIVKVIAKDERVGEELFDFIYRVAEIGEQGGGTMFMAQLDGCTPFTLPEIEEVLKAAKEADD